MFAVRIISLNVGHQTWARPIPTTVVAALPDQQPDIVVLVEYVDALDAMRDREKLAQALGEMIIGASPILTEWTSGE